jgi:hypothetical protein
VNIASKTAESARDRDTQGKYQKRDESGSLERPRSDLSVEIGVAAAPDPSINEMGRYNMG